MEIYVFSGLLFAVTGGLVLFIPDLGEPTRDGGLWAIVVVAVTFGLFEYFDFILRFRKEAISFTLSEVPTAFALVFLSPLVAFAARLPLSAISLRLRGPMKLHKLVFNVAVYSVELATAFVVFRAMTGRSEDDLARVIVSVVISLVLVTPLSSVLVSVAIARVEGGTIDRIVTDLSQTWWLTTVNAALAGMSVTLAIIEPWITLVAVPAIMGIWFVLRRYGEVGQDLRDLDELHGFSGRVGQSLDIDQIGNDAVSEIGRLLRARGVALVRFVHEDNRRHEWGNFAFNGPVSPMSPGWPRLLEGGGVHLLNANDLKVLGENSEGQGRLLVTAIADEGGPIAVLMIAEDSEPSDRFGPATVTRVVNLSEQLAASLRKGLLHERIEFEARHDALTGLPSRTPFELEVGKVVRDPPDLVACVLMLDLDRFKEVNDTLGHHAGDDLLIQFAGRMTSLLQGDDVLARLAGDEFAILCSRDSLAEIHEFAQLCVESGGKPVILDGLEIVVTVSCGVALITRADDDAVQPMRRADIAMYNAKWQRTGVELYRDEIDRRTPARLSMLGDLRASIENDELAVVYQPKLDLATGQVVGVEALVRWDHPTRGVVPPSEFVRVAEDTGLIKELTDMVMLNGIKMLRRFSDAGLTLGLAVNLSTHDLFDARLPDRVRSHLESNGVAAESLTLEITESSLFVDAPRTRATIDDLHAAGLRMTIDDFGTGYSSLSYLRRLPVNELKIDQSFVYGMLTDPQDEVIVRSTVDLGHNLDLLVVAEGVESLAVLERLRDIGCDVAQGYYVSQPLGADELLEWLHKAAAAHVAESPISWVGSVS
jgi:diguanylate cyclase (GGDEF)-like protein